MATTSKQDLENLKKSLRKRADRLVDELEQIEADIESANRMLELLGGKSKSQVWPESYLREFDNLSQIQALVKLAKDNENRLVVSDAKRLFVATRLCRSKKNLASIVYSAVGRSQRFKKIGRGQYELTSTPIVVKTERQVG